jgi:hypothetical protein
MKKRTFACLFAVAGVSVAAILAASAGAVGLSTTTEQVTPATLSFDATHWYFYNDTTDIPSTTEDPAHYKFVTGPGAPPAGVGSVFFHNDAPNTNQRWDINTRRYAGTNLTTLTALKFNTYEPAGNAPGNAIFENFDVNFGVAVPGYPGRLVYVPRDNGTVLAATWQEWDTTSPGALWRWSHYDRGPDNNLGTVGDNNRWPDGNPAPLRTWSDIVTSFPSATMDNPLAPGYGQLVYRAGEPYPAGFTGYLDKVTVGVSGNSTVFDFEPLIGPPTSKDQCKNGGWQQFNNPPFKNQGDCNQYVNTGK